MKTFLLLLSFLISGYVYSQNSGASNTSPNIKTKIDTLYKPFYPEGIYISKSDFINKKPSSFEKVYPHANLDSEKAAPDSIVHACYFYYTKTDKKIKNVFAISYKGHLFFQTKSILKNRNKNDRAQSTNYHNTFVRVILGGNNYLYTEAELVNQWAAGTAANFGVVGGVMLQDLIKGKGIVWDFKNQEFNIFKSCKDYNEFIQDRYPEGVQEVLYHQPDMFRVRKAIDRIK